MAKEKVRSLRLNSTVVEMIEAQTGENFTQKFESLVIRCMFELPEVDMELETVKEQIKEKKEYLRRLETRVSNYKLVLDEIKKDLDLLHDTIKHAQTL